MILRLRRFVPWVGLSLLVALSLVACGGDGDGDSGDNGGGATATATSGDGGGNGTSGGNSDPFADLNRLTQGLDNATGRTSYTITMEGQTSSYTVYSDGTNSRFDATDSGVTYTTITKDGETIACDSSSETCISGTAFLPGASLLNVLTSVLSSGAVGAAVAQAQAAGADVQASSEEHAGTDATCYTWSDDSGGEDSDGKVCFASNGVLLYEEITSGSEAFKIEATEFSEDVSESDFEPPYDVQ